MKMNENKIKIYEEKYIVISFCFSAIKNKLHL